jgi:RNA polymerase sigma-70 factor (ECF subfamily)
MPDPSHARTLLELRAAQAGDREAAEQLFTRYRDRLLEVVSLLMARRRGALLEDEEDIVQESLLDAFLHLEGFEPRSEGAFLHWLSRIAENNLRQSARRKLARKRGEGRVRRSADLSGSLLLSSLFPGREPTPSQAAGSRELAERIEAVVIALPERDRRAFVLRRLCELSFEEVAEELGLGGAASARKLYSRVLVQIGSRIPDLGTA